MATQKRRPPWGATQKQAAEHAATRRLKNRIHELEAELERSNAERQRLTETNVALNMRVNELSVEVANLRNGGVYTGATVEQAVRERVDAEVSRYALGVLKFLFASGKVPL